MGIYHNKTVILTIYKHKFCTLPLPCFQEYNSESEIVYNIANPYKIYFILKFRKFFVTQNISVAICFEVSPRPLGYSQLEFKVEWSVSATIKHCDKSKLSHMAKGIPVVKLLPICQ